MFLCLLALPFVLLANPDYNLNGMASPSITQDWRVHTIISLTIGEGVHVHYQYKTVAGPGI
jgi:hypothetical protein